MLMAYDDLGFKIADIPSNDPRVPVFPIESREKADEILEWAKVERPSVDWKVETQDGAFRVVAKG
jgi:hypothetical protein